MKLIFIYGAPAVGKLTVAQELAKKTNLKLIDNHLTGDLITSVFEIATPAFFELNENIRFELVKKAKEEKIKGIIFTSCYALKKDDEYIKRSIKKFKRIGVEMLFVHLHCSIETLNKRVKAKSRKNTKKLKTKKGLAEVMKKWELTQKMPFVEHLSINTDEKSAKESAKIIKKHYKL